MTRADLAAELRAEAVDLSDERLAAELGGILPSEELAGLAPRVKAATIKLAEWLEEHPERDPRVIGLDPAARNRRESEERGTAD